MSNAVVECLASSIQSIFEIQKFRPALSMSVSSERLLSGHVSPPPDSAADWWSVLVKLPCEETGQSDFADISTVARDSAKIILINLLWTNVKPAWFSFRNAFCLNSARRASGSYFTQRGSYLLTHRVASPIVFDAILNDACQIKIEEVEVVWERSFPIHSVPRISSVPTLHGEKLIKFFDQVQKGENLPVRLSINYPQTIPQTIPDPISVAPRKRHRRAMDYYDYYGDDYFATYWDDYRPVEDTIIGLDFPCDVAQLNVSQSTVLRSLPEVRHKHFGRRHLIAVSAPSYKRNVNAVIFTSATKSKKFLHFNM